MVFEIIIATVIIIALIIASITDIKTREVPDWLNYSLVALGLGIRLIWSVATDNFNFFIEGLFGFGVFFLLALVMFYTGQWGGGDSKMLMGLGALIGFNISINATLVSLLVNIITVGAIYGFIWSTIIAIKKRKEFFAEFNKISKSYLKIKKIMLAFFALCIIIILIADDIVFKFMIGALILIVYLSFYLVIYMKSIEKSCMLRLVKPTDVTEGDWIAKDIYINKKYVAGPKDLGIEKKQLEKLIGFYKKGKIKNVLIKVGIPFIPSFFMAYIVTLIYGNLLLTLL